MLQKALLSQEDRLAPAEKGEKDWTDVEPLIRKLDNLALSQSLYS